MSFWPSADLAHGAPTVRKGTDGEGQRGDRLIVRDAARHPGAFVATYLGQAVGWYQAGQGAGFIGAVVGAIILLVIYRFVKR